MTWVPEYPNPAFTNALPPDNFWAAKQVMAFTDEQIRAIVKTAEYTDKRAEDYIADALIERRDKIGRAFLRQVLPLDRFTVKEGELVFEDLEKKHGLVTSRELKVQWLAFDNQTERTTPITGETSFRIPAKVAEGTVCCGRCGNRGSKHMVTVYLRKRAGRMQVVGVDRSW